MSRRRNTSKEPDLEKSPICQAILEAFKPQTQSSWLSNRASELRCEGENFLITFKDGVTFADLAIISEIFGGTKAIDIGSEDRQGGYCETCAYSYTVAVVNVRGMAETARAGARP